MIKDKREVAEELRALIDILEKLGVKPFLWAGTLLGAIREKSFITVDDDVDIAYISNYKEPSDVMKECLDLYKKIEEIGLLHNYFNESFQPNVDEENLTAFGQAHVILNKEKKRGFTADLFTMWICNERFYDPWFGDIGKPEDFVYKNNCAELEGILFPALEEPENVLKFLYGKDWVTPRKEKGTKRNKFRCALKICRKEEEGVTEML